jgi:hypothetical protein
MRSPSRDRAQHIEMYERPATARLDPSLRPPEERDVERGRTAPTKQASRGRRISSGRHISAATSRAALRRFWRAHAGQNRERANDERDADRTLGEAARSIALLTQG